MKHIRAQLESKTQNGWWSAALFPLLLLIVTNASPLHAKKSGKKIPKVTTTTSDKATDEKAGNKGKVQDTDDGAAANKQPGGVTPAPTDVVEEQADALDADSAEPSTVRAPTANVDAETGSERPRLLILDLLTKDVDVQITGAVVDVVTTAFDDFDYYQVSSKEDVRQLLELEGNKSAFGCLDESCIAEIAGALGAEYVVTGRIGKLGSLYVVKVSLLKPMEGKTVGHESVESPTVEALPELLRIASRRLHARVVEEPLPDYPPRTSVANASATEREDDDEGGILGEIVAGSGVGLLVLGALATGATSMLAVGLWAATTMVPTSPALVKFVGLYFGPSLFALALWTVAGLPIALAITALGGGIMLVE